MINARQFFKALVVLFGGVLDVAANEVCWFKQDSYFMSQLFLHSHYLLVHADSCPFCLAWKTAFLTSGVSAFLFLIMILNSWSPCLLYVAPCCKHLLH